MLAGISLALVNHLAQYQHCVDLMTELQESGVDGSSAKPFPTTGRTLAVVIEDVLAKRRRFRLAAKGNGQAQALTPFPGGVLAYHPRHIELAGETIAEASRRGLAWQILQALGQTNDKGRPIHLGSRALARKLRPQPEQNTLIRAVCSLRARLARIVAGRLDHAFGQEDVIANDDQGYHLADGIVVAVYDEEGTLISQVDGAVPGALKTAQGTPKLVLGDKHRWVMARLAENGALTRRQVEQAFGISDRTAKRVLGELSDAGLIEFDRTTHPGFYRLK